LEAYHEAPLFFFLGKLFFFCDDYDDFLPLFFFFFFRLAESTSGPHRIVTGDVLSLFLALTWRSHARHFFHSDDALHPNPLIHDSPSFLLLKAPPEKHRRPPHALRQTLFWRERTCIPLCLHPTPVRTPSSLFPPQFFFVNVYHLPLFPPGQLLFALEYRPLSFKG